MVISTIISNPHENEENFFVQEQYFGKKSKEQDTNVNCCQPHINISNELGIVMKVQKVNSMTKTPCKIIHSTISAMNIEGKATI